MKKIVITGCTKGLGRALVDEFIELGHTVIGCGRNSEAILDLRFSVAAPNSFDVLDVAEAKKVELWAERMLTLHGAPDLVINNAGSLTDPAPLWKQNSAEVARLFQVNLTGVVHVIQGFVPAMIERGSGVVVNFSSGWGRSVSANFAPYCASKWGVEGLTRALAEELPAPLAAVPLSPGVIDTAMLRQCYADGASDYPDPATWAKVAAPFLLQLDRKDNGQSLTVPGF
ncbi:oxidoreductase [Verrucomicrobia bacterium IMCC26134]|jgi:NAD(P)-dependent dehydrogenase (short-subunit alcohol dehydrogenase family)|nr:oxidoreductase [Verrucomicrobia bacterium IMCC26134]